MNGYRFEVEPQRDRAGRGPVVRYEIQESRGLDEDGVRCYKVWLDTEDLERAQESYAIVRGFSKQGTVRLVKVTTEIVEVAE